MTALKNNIDHYMELKSIKMYSHLLANIARELGMKGQEAYRFAEREKANFSKMLKGERPLKYEFIIPLEKIFGVSLARLMNEDAYKLPVEKENVAFDKGFRYYAFVDDPVLYEKEFDKLLDINGKTILNNTDEFGKTFLDYVAEYGSVNGIKYLYDNYKPRMRWWHNEFQFDKEKGITWLHIENAMPLVRLVASMHDADMFYTIFDSYYMYFLYGSYIGDGNLFCTEEYLELIMDDDILFTALFDIKEYHRELGSSSKRKYGKKFITYYSANPILNNCLKHALRNLSKYRNQAIEILKFGIKHNQHIADEHNSIYCYICNELGAVKDCKNDDYYELAIVTYEKDVKDQEINNLIELLPKFNDHREWRKCANGMECQPAFKSKEQLNHSSIL